MTIARLKKITLLGDIEDKQLILEQLQDLGALHLIPLTAKESEESGNKHEKLKETISYLEACPHKRRAQSPQTTEPLEHVITKVLDNKAQRSKAHDKIDLIKTRLRDLRPWGSFEYPELDTLDGYRLWFYHVPISRETELPDIKLPWKILSKDHKQLYVVVIANEEPDEQSVPFTRVHVGSRSLKQLKQDLEQTRIALEDLNAERQALTRWLQPLQQSLSESINLSNLAIAASGTRDMEHCFALSAWIPVKRLPELKKHSLQCGFAYTEQSPGLSDNPPTLLENNTTFGGGESAVSFFQLPGYQSWDPSVVIFFSFSLFFAIILADAGYALILAAMLAPFWKRLGKTDNLLKLRNFACAIIASATIYGVLIGSYFGIVLAPDSFLARLQILDLNDFNSMMQLSIGIGALHVIIANATVGWQERHKITALSNLGWILLIGCAYLMWFQYVHYDQEPAQDTFLFWISVLGFLLILLCSSDRKIVDLKSLVLRLFDSVLAIYQLTRAFGDVLSYMRLFALGLSSASLAYTFNQLALDAADAVPAGGGVLFFLIIVLGHLLNFVLAIIGGLIHGLRLNLLEFYGWAIKGEGIPFVAFEKKKAKRT